MCEEGFFQKKVIKKMPEGKVGICWAKIRVGGGQESILFQVDGIACKKAPNRKKS